MSTAYEIPIIYQEARFKIRTVLDGIELVLYFYWTTRQERWNLDIFDSAEVSLVKGVVLNIDRNLLAQYEISGLPRGNLILYDTSQTHAECGYTDLGDRCRLIYQSFI